MTYHSQITMSTTMSCFTTSNQLEKLYLGHGSHHGFQQASIRRQYSSVLMISAAKHGFGLSSKQILVYFNASRRERSNFLRNMDLNAINNLNSRPPIPSGSPFRGWLNWILLTILTMIIPIFKGKWGPLLALKKQVSTAIETVECISEIVEDVAKTVDHIADELVENLPDGSKLKQAICMVDELAEDVIKGTDFVQDLVHKAEDAQKQLENLIENPAMNKEEKVAMEPKAP